MQATPRRNGVVLVIFGLVMLVIVMLALSSTTWAAPNMQGTVPTPPGGATATPTSGDDGGGGGGSGGDNGNDNGGDNGGGAAQPTAAPAGVGSGSVCAIGDSGAQCTAGDLVIVVGAGAASAGSALTIEGTFPQPPCPSSPANHNFLNRCYRYAWIGTNALPLNGINAPVQYCIGYGAEQLAAVKNKPETLVIGVASGDGAWSLLKPTVDAAGSRVCATSNQLITWSALFAPQTVSALLPTVGAPTDAWWLAALVGIGAILLVGAFQIRRRAN